MCGRKLPRPVSEFCKCLNKIQTLDGVPINMFIHMYICVCDAVVVLFVKFNFICCFGF